MAFTPTALLWQEPLQVATGVAARAGNFVFLHSSLPTGYSGRFSVLAWEELEAVEGTSLHDLVPDHDGAEHMVLGYFGYESAGWKARMPEPTLLSSQLPAFRFARYRYCLRFDHQTQLIEAWDGSVPDALPIATVLNDASTRSLQRLESDMSKEEYLRWAAEAIAHIQAGSFYQVNLTRKFFGQFKEPPSSAQLYHSLIDSSPAPYSAWLRIGDLSVLSSSPELFLRVGKEALTSRPIKGTLARAQTAEEDDAQVARLQQSAKDRAENLMIVDLMRHDLAQAAEPGSVRVEKCFEVDTFATLHHLSSEITAQRAKGITPIDALAAAFPPGSMTGAPKRAAMQWLARAEPYPRGIYSGAIGWMSAEEAEFSVVIRTLLLSGSAFEFQVGGGIVADSLPEQEWQETLLKARGIARALGIPDEELVRL